MEQKYPERIDMLWLAADGKGQIAAFLTAGEGPVPRTTLWARLHAPLDAAEADLSSLPFLGEGEIKVSVPRPEGFRSLADRGLVVFDWRSDGKPSAYRLAALPSSVLCYHNLSPALRAALAGVVLFEADFYELQEIDLKKFNVPSVVPSLVSEAPGGTDSGEAEA